MFALELESPSQPLIFIGGRVCGAAQHEAARERGRNMRLQQNVMNRYPQ